MTAVFLRRFSSVSVIEQPDYQSLQVATPAGVTATGGSATTVVSTALTDYSSDNADFVGYIVECLSATNAANIGRRARILEYVHASGTCTVDAFPAVVTAGDTFALYVPPNPIWVESTGASATDIVDSRRDEANDFWNGHAAAGGPYMEVIASDNALSSDHPRISDHVSATGTTTVSPALSGNGAVGDYFEAWRHPEFFEASYDTSRDEIERGPMTGTLFSPGKLIALRSATFSGSLAFRGPGAASRAEIDPFLTCVTTAGKGDDLTAGASTTESVAWTAGTAVANRFYLTSAGDAFFLRSDIVTPTIPYPTLRSAPPTGSTISAMVTYTPSSSVNGALSVKGFEGNTVLSYLYGLVPKVSYSGTKGGLLDISIAGDPVDWCKFVASSAERDWTPVRPSIAPRKIEAIRVSVGNTAFAARRFSFSPDPQLVDLANVTAVNATDGKTLGGWIVTGEIECYLSATNRAEIDAWIAGNERSIFIQCGTRAGDPGVIALYCPNARYTGAPISDDGGALTITLPFEGVFHADQSTGGYSAFAIGIL